ncbi:hypothetical protein B0T24DRAFT_702803 [Lasiosphaeria ovina]|uniref:Dystroglycan-type cadherin-like domain-containing protein n=1 Tax=Lasiosphaeria ovina TaxID=92902 RepID=A0AAE0N7T2_9PEZI|nr:hypothetical protein B0T24DRAFT_702803 [Lasiosphaeria ovina]
MAPSTISWTALLLAGLSAASPTISFPLNSQVPPVARIGKPFSFVFSPATFSSKSAIVYTLASSPRWLAIDSSARRLFGTPDDADVAPGQVLGVPIGLVATDVSGSTSLNITLVVSRSPGPRVNVPLEQQPPRFGVFSEPSSILTPPELRFLFDLAQDTFVDPSGGSLNYYAVMADNTPLPAWVSFDPNRLSFSGQTPPFSSLIQPPQLFAFRLIASDVVGFAGVSLSFDIVVGAHEISSAQTAIVLDAKIGEPVLYTALRDNIKIDGQKSTTENVVIASTPNIPQWLSVDKATWHISGVPLEGAASTNFTIALQDKFSDTLNLTVHVNIPDEAARGSSLFKGGIPVQTTTAGKPFSLDLGPYLSHPEDTEITIVAAPSSAWVRVGAGTTTISGNISDGSNDSLLSITIKATSRRSGKSESASITIHVQPGPGESPTAAPTKPTTGTSDGQVFPANESGTRSTILVATLLPVLLLLLAATILLFCWFRSRKNPIKSKPSADDLLGPFPGIFVTDIGEQKHHSGFPPGRFDKPQSMVHEVHPNLSDSTSSRLGDWETDSETAQPLTAVRLLPSTERGRSATGNLSKAGRTSLLASLQSHKQHKESSSIDYVSETSLYGDTREIIDGNSLALFGNRSRGSLRDALEITIPSFGKVSSIQRTPDPAYTGSGAKSQWWDTDSKSSPSGRVPLTEADQEVQPLRTESRLGYYPPSPSGKFSWPWLKGALAKGNTTACRLSTSSVDTFAYKKESRTPERSRQRDEGPSALDSSHPPLAKLPKRDFYARPVTRRGPDECFGVGLSFGTPSSTRARQGNRGKEVAETGSVASHESSPDFLGISCKNLQRMPAPIPSDTWSTVLSTDRWGDETTRSSDDTGRTRAAASGGTAEGSARNWTALEDSPIIRDWNFDQISRLESETESPSRGSAAQGRAEASTGTSIFTDVVSIGDVETDKSRKSENASRTGSKLDRHSRPQVSRDDSDYAVYI